MSPRCMVIALVCVPASVAGQSDEDVRIALSLLPPGARSAASVYIERDQDSLLVREGNGAFTCVVRDANTPRYTVSCYSENLASLRAVERDVGRRRGPPSAGSNAICQVMDARGESVTPGAMEISASGAWGAGGKRPSELTAFYLVYLPGATEASLGLRARAPADPALPWLHHAGTCRAHIMWSGVTGGGSP